MLSKPVQANQIKEIVNIIGYPTLEKQEDIKFSKWAKYYKQKLLIGYIQIIIINLFNLKITLIFHN